MGTERSIVAFKQRVRKDFVLNLIRTRRSISRTQFAELTGINAPTITHIVKGLQQEGLVSEDGYYASSVGRRAVRLSINYTSKHVLGLHVGRHQITGLVSDLGGTILSQCARPLTASDARILVGDVGQVATKTASDAGIDLSEIQAVGLGIAGIVDSNSGLSKWFPYTTDWSDVPLQHMLQEALGVPVWIENDLNAAALGGGWFSDVELKHVLYLYLGDHVGLGMFLNGRLHRGREDEAGRIAHIVVDEEGPECSCGHRGCLETMVSEEAIVSTAEKALARGVRSSLSDVSPVTFDQVIEAANSGDGLAFNVLDRAGQYTGKVLVGLINVLNPDKIILGGDLVRAGDHFLGTLRREIRLGVALQWNVEDRLIVSEPYEDFLALGGAALAVRKVFQVEEIQNLVCI